MSRGWRLGSGWGNVDWDCGIVGLGLGIRVRHLITIMCRILKTTEYSTSPHQTLEPVCQNVMTAEGVPLTCTGVAQVLPLCYHLGSACSEFGPEGLVLASVVLDFLDIFPRSRCSLSRLLWNLQLNNSWASLTKMWRLAFDGHSYFEVFWGCLPSVLSVLMLKKHIECIYWNELCCIIKGYSASHVGRALQSNTFNTYGRGNVKHDLTISISSILIHTLMFFVWQQKSAYEQCLGNQRGSDQVCKARLRGGQSWSWQVIKVLVTVKRLLITNNHTLYWSILVHLHII